MTNPKSDFFTPFITGVLAIKYGPNAKNPRANDAPTKNFGCNFGCFSPPPGTAAAATTETSYDSDSDSDSDNYNYNYHCHCEPVKLNFHCCSNNIYKTYIAAVIGKKWTNFV